jgi:signal transduction histidine kinase
MELRLVSKDADLHKLCREILKEFPERLWTVMTGVPADTAPAPDLYIWDYQSEEDLPQVTKNGSSAHLFLVHRKDLARFYQAAGTTQANILLKPVTRVTLASFLGLAVAAHQERLPTARSLRADRDEILQCLIQANLKLQEYDQDRTNFLTRAVHDFRAPLTAISGYCGLLLSEPMGQLNEDQKEVLRRMQHSAKRLSRMAAAMFQLSVGRRVKRRPELQPIDIRNCVEQSLHEIAQFADSKRIAITVELDAEPPALYSEPGQIEQVLINLLDNACKFTPKDGEIRLRGYPYFWERRTSRVEEAFTHDQRRGKSTEPNSYRIDMIDSGPTIPGEHLDQIFEEYTSYGGGQDRSGGGLGLAICRMIITQHDGQVWAENTSAGPMFSFILPYHINGPVPQDSGEESPNYAEV